MDTVIESVIETIKCSIEKLLHITLILRHDGYYVCDHRNSKEPIILKHIYLTTREQRAGRVWGLDNLAYIGDALITDTRGFHIIRITDPLYFEKIKEVWTQ